MFGLTQTALSAMSGVGQSTISKVENNDEEPSPGMLQQLADATGTPVTFFQASPSTVPLDSLRFRKRATASKKTTKRIHAIYAESYRVTEQLMHEVYPAPPLPYATEDDDLDQEQIETYAMATRQALRLAPDKPIPHLTRAMERAGVAVAPMSLADADPDQQITSGKHFGVSYWGGPGETALIGYFAGSGDRDRFTLAHELGHLVLHTFRPRCADPEKEANQFAGALLVPYDRAVEELGRTTLTSLAHKKAAWGVSIGALIMRAASVGVIDEPRRKSLFIQRANRGWHKDEPVNVVHEHPLLLWKLLAARFGDKPYRLAADELAFPPAILRSIAPTPASPAQAERTGSVAQLRRVRPEAAADRPARRRNC